MIRWLILYSTFNTQTLDEEEHQQSKNGNGQKLLETSEWSSALD